MNFINSITNMPLWVWAILAFFVDIGLKSMHQHVVYIPRLFLIPVIMVILKFKDVVATNLTAILALLLLCVGSVIAIFFARQTAVIFDKKAWTVQLPGSYVTFMFLMIFFGLKLIFQYFEKNNLDADFMIADIVMSALFAGYFLGRACYFSYKFKKSVLV